MISEFKVCSSFLDQQWPARNWYGSFQVCLLQLSRSYVSILTSRFRHAGIVDAVLIAHAWRAGSMRMASAC